MMPIMLYLDCFGKLGDNSHIMRSRSLLLPKKYRSLLITWLPFLLVWIWAARFNLDIMYHRFALRYLVRGCYCRGLRFKRAAKEDAAASAVNRRLDVDFQSAHFAVILAGASGHGSIFLWFGAYQQLGGEYQ